MEENFVSLIRTSKTSNYSNFTKWATNPRLEKAVPLPLGIYDLFILRNSRQESRILRTSKFYKLTAEIMKKANPKNPFSITKPITAEKIAKAYFESPIPRSFLDEISDPVLLRFAIALGGFDPLTLDYLYHKFPFLKNEKDRNGLLPSQKQIPSDLMILDTSSVFPIKFLGVGSFGAVFVVWIWGYGKIVLKIPINKEDRTFLRECRVLSTLGCTHPNVLCSRMCLPKGQGILTDYYEGYVDLKLWRECAGKKYYSLDPVKNSPELISVIATIFRQILEGVKFLHSRGFVHRDIKLDNILVKWDVPVIIDFGLAITRNAKFPGLNGTPYYFPREIFELSLRKNMGENYPPGSEIYDIYTKVDIYGVGVCLYRVLKGVVPFDVPDEKYKPKDQRDLDAVLNGAFGKSPPPVPEPVFQPLIDGLFAPADQRWTCEQGINFLGKLEGV